MTKKRTLIALATGAAAAGACAQSSVTVSGIIDVGITQGRASGLGSARLTQLSSSNMSTSRLIFRGVEELGNGLSAGFWLEAALSPDNGTAGGRSPPDNRSAPAAAGLNFSRRSTVSLAGTWGELRLGRDVTPSQVNIYTFDPFVSVGVGASAMITAVASNLGAPAAKYGLLPAGLGGAGPYVRASNMVSYFTPNTLSGFNAQVGYWLGEGLRDGSLGESDGSGASVRLGYDNGPFSGAVSWARTAYKATPVATTPNAPSGDSQLWSVGAEWRFSMFRLMGQYSYDTRESAVKAAGRGWLVGALVPVGAGVIRGSLSEYRIDAGAGAVPRATKLAIGYVHNLSKRTALYATVAYVRNSDGARLALGGSTFGNGIGDGRSRAYEAGIRHSF